MTSTDIDKLEVGRELDALVAERVMGWHIEDAEGHWLLVEKGKGELFCLVGPRIADNSPNWSYWSPSTSISAAWEVWEHMKTKPTPQGGIYWYTFVEMLEEGIDWDYPNDCINITDLLGSLNPLAICRAALKAVELK